METALWKWVFYRPIEEFRHRVRFAADAGERGKEPLRKVITYIITYISRPTHLPFTKYLTSETSSVWDHHTAYYRMESLLNSSVYISGDRM